MRHNLELTRNDSALFDTVRTARAIEQGMQHIWERHADGLEPAHYTIAERNRPALVARPETGGAAAAAESAVETDTANGAVDSSADTPRQ